MRLFPFIFSMVALFLALPVFAATPRTFSFVVPSNSKTSGGVFDSSGTLIRTLWNGKSYNAGTYYVAWDGNYDQHADVIAPAPEATYTLKVLSNNVVYNWDGIVGNTSSSFTSPNVWKTLFGPADLAINANGVAVMANGQNEGQPSARRFFTSDPQTPVPVPVSRDSWTTWSHVATDSTRYYFTLKGSNDPQNSNFVIARNISDDSTYAFPNGVDLVVGQGAGAKYYNGVIDASQQGGGVDDAFSIPNRAGGLAVQPNGNNLAVAHGPLNSIRLFDKNSGASLGQITVTNPQEISFAPNGDLYVITVNTVVRFAAGNLGQTNDPVSSITGLTYPIAVDVSPSDSNTVLVMDSGGSQQVKSFTYTSSWSLNWTLGQLGGYNTANGPDVTEGASTVKFSFTNGILAIQPDGSFWVGDYGNNRVLHYGGNRSYIDHISFIGSSGAVIADPNDPTRLFSNNWLEYKIDYSKTLVPGDPGSNGSWKLVKNWRTGMDTSNYGGFTSVVTLGGRTYGTVKNNTYIDQVFELPLSGNLRNTGAAPPQQGLTGMYKNGDFRTIQGEGTGTITVLNYAGSGFDTGNPSWSFSSPTVLASTPANAPTREVSYDPSPWGNWMPTTSTNRVVFYNGTGFGYDRSIPGSYHLGVVPVGGTNWLWRGSPGKLIQTPDGMGTYSTKYVYGGLGGLSVFAEGTDIIWGFNGQYGTFSNQYVHYDDDGLFVGQFGVPQGNETTPGFAGNYLGMWIVKHGTKLYAYNSDESGHPGIARWSISGLDTIQNITGAISTRPGDATNLVAESLTSSQMSLTWSDNSNNETGFKIERATNSTFTQNLTQVTTTAANTNSYTDTGLTLYQVYYYRVRATNASGDSNYTNTSLNEPADKLTGTIIAHDGGYADTQPAFAFDGNFATYFKPTGYVFGAGWVGYDLGAPKTISKIKYAPGIDHQLEGVFQVSNTADFSSGVVDLFIPDFYAPQNQYTVFKLPTRIGGYRYIRYFGNNIGWPRLAEMEVWGSNAYPVVNLTSPTANQVYPTAPATVTISATASEAGGTISKVEFYNGSNLLNSDTTSPYSYSWTGVALGAYQVYARAYDANNVMVESSKAPITVGNSIITGLVGKWKMDEGSGLAAADATSNNRHGTLESGTAWVPNGKYGSGLSFDGVDDDVLVNSNFGLGNNSITIGAWVNLATASKRGSIVKIGGAYGFGIGVGSTTFEDNGNNLILLYENVRWINTGVAIGTGWNHVAMVISASGEPQAYLNGALLSAYPGPNGISPTGGQTYFGGYGGRRLNALIDDVHIYNRALSGAEIVSMMNNAVPAIPSGVSATTISSSRINLAWTDNSNNETGFRVERATNAAFTQGLTLVTTTAANATSYSNTGLAANTQYYYRIRSTNATGDSANSTAANAVTQYFSTGADIGAPALAGSSSSSGGVYTITGAGADISGNSDQFQYDYRTVTGNQTLVAKITSLSNTNPWAKAGVMFRDSTAANSMFAHVVATPGQGVSFEWRNSTGGGAGFAQVSSVPAPSAGTPVWVKLVRSGTSYSGYYSVNGTTWTQIGSTQTITFVNSTYLQGLAVTSHDTAALATATFTEVISAVAAVPSGLGASPASASQINLTWIDNAFSETGYKIERATNSTFTQNLTLVTTTAANATSYSNTGLSVSTLYYYRVRATNTVGDSANSGTASATTQYGVGNNAQFISQSVPTTMTAGRVYTVSVTMKNTGDNTWTNGGLWRLGSQNPQDNDIWGLGRVYTNASVAPGQQHTFTYNITAPVTDGTYNFQWRMLQEGVMWFGGFSTNVAVTISTPSGPSGFSSPSYLAAGASDNSTDSAIPTPDFRLSIRIQEPGSRVILSWSTLAGPSIIPMSSDGLNGPWRSVPGVPIIVGDQFELDAGVAGGRGFFCLPRP